MTLFRWILLLTPFMLVACSSSDGNESTSTPDTTGSSVDTESDHTTDPADTDSPDTVPLSEIPTTPHITVDQFGYPPDGEKIAVIRDPQTGYDADASFDPSDIYALVDAASEETVFSAAPTSWNDGATDESSGDRAWWFDFSSVVTPGTYYVVDLDAGVRSPQFRISASVYQTVMKHAMRTFFYQRAGHAKELPYAEEAWADDASHLGPLQDTQARRWDAPEDASTERDLSGGWYDAGDYNKYTNWHCDYLLDMLRAYQHNPQAFTDDYDIPESGNGIPDILDEAKWGMDWVVKMQEDDGSVLSIVSLDHGTPPSAADGPSLYGDASTSATLSAAAAFAFGATVFEAAGMDDYADGLRIRAQDAWQWAQDNPDVTFRNNDGATAGIGAGQQEVDDYGRLTKRIQAAIYLFEATGNTDYRQVVDDLYDSVNMMEWTFAFPFQERNQENLLYYAALSDASAAVATQVTDTYETAMNGTDNFQAFDNDVDPYLAYIKDYTWGSNRTKAAQGNMFMALVTYGINTDRHADARRAARRYIHYIHGVNPLSMVYLSNMYGAGAHNSVNEFYHSWFHDGSSTWDRVGVSTWGPAPGFLVGGPNPSYDVDGCCPDSCGSDENNALCSSESVVPPLNQPDQKSYKDFNTTWPLNSWSVTENSNGYQLQYIRLLAHFVE